MIILALYIVATFIVVPFALALAILFIGGIQHICMAETIKKSN